MPLCPRPSPAGLSLRSIPSSLRRSSPALRQATPIPKKLSADLRELAEKRSAPAAARALAPGAQFVREDAIVLDQESIRAPDEQGRVAREDLLRRQQDARPSCRLAFEAIEGTRVTAVSGQYRAGVIEVFVPEEQLVDVAKSPGVLQVVSSSSAVFDVGATTSQGVRAHRVDKLPGGIDGRGITVGVMSDSYDMNPDAGLRMRPTIWLLVISGRAIRLGTHSGRRSGRLCQGGDEGAGHDADRPRPPPKSRSVFPPANTGGWGFANTSGRWQAYRRDPRGPRVQADVIVAMSSTPPSPSSRTYLGAGRRRRPRRASSYFSSAGKPPWHHGLRLAVRLVLNEPESSCGDQRQAQPGAARPYRRGIPQLCRQPGSRRTSRNDHRWRNDLVPMNEPYDPTPPALGAISLQGSGATTPRRQRKTFQLRRHGWPDRSHHGPTPTRPSPTPIRRRYHLVSTPAARKSRSRFHHNPEVLVQARRSGTYTLQGGFRRATGGLRLQGTGGLRRAGG